MRMPLGILAVVALLLVAFLGFAPPPDPDLVRPRTDLPWQVTGNPDGSSRVFDLQLGTATLAEAIAKFGPVEAMALFEPAAGPLALEAFFGNVRLGPLNAKVVVGLAASDDELRGLRGASRKREGSPSGDWKYSVDDSAAKHAGRRLTAITYIPSTRGLDADFFRERFGEPSAWRQENENAVTWFYPQFGLTVLIDDRAREVLEYQAPRDFVMPDGVTRNPAVR